MKLGVIGAICAGLALPASAQTDLPDFATCMDAEMARFERALRRHGTMSKADEFDIGDVRGVDYCGTVGIVTCDRGTDPVPCQFAFAEAQNSLQGEVLESLPEPAQVTRGSGYWSDDLYPMLWDLAHGSSAGPDCAGATKVMEAWCEAREANRALATSISLWQLGRYLEVAQSGVEAGWARVLPPTRPQPRPLEASQ